MHYGNIDGDTAAGRVYRVLRQRRGEWVGGWDLSMAARTTAVSTRVSEVRRQLPEGEILDVKQEGREFYYRLEQAGQLALFA